MKVLEKKASVRSLVENLDRGLLTRNPEYQRGEAWDEAQKQTFADSILRGYPVPALFFHRIAISNLEGGESVKYEIVDGQQRLTALRDFTSNKFAMLAIDDKKLRLPPSIRKMPAPWAGRYFRDLVPELHSAFLDTEILVYYVTPDSSQDEIRDLFIRLQSGTALTRQQVRDAWPGQLGPFVEELAGKLSRRPAVGLFRVIDRRGVKTEEEDQKDQFVADRQMCASLLNVFIARASDPFNVPSSSARDLDGLYHERTEFDASGELATAFKKVLELATAVFKKASDAAAQGGVAKKEKFRRIEVLAVCMYLQDMLRGALYRFDPPAVKELAHRVITKGVKVKAEGKGTSGRVVAKFYEDWRSAIGIDLGARLDPKRAFDDEDKKEIFERADGKCTICGEAVERDEEEYDHFPVPHRDGGQTRPDNGRLVHRACHPRTGPPRWD